MRVPVQRDRDELELKMTPMIDVVFLLLVFFLWTSSFEEPEFNLPSSLAEPPMSAGVTATTAPVEEFDEIVVRIKKGEFNNVFLMNDQSLESIAELKQQLSAIVALGVQPPVIVDPDQSVEMGTAIEVYDTCRSIGFDRVLFAAKSPS